MSVKSVTHMLGVDLEDWYLDVGHTRATPREAARAIGDQLHVLRGILDASATRCTFFVLGTTAERYPALVRELSQDGHEIGAHGYRHARLDRLSWAERRDDIARAFDVIADITGVAPRGYRAPYFSADRITDLERFYDLLRAAGFRYSSSCRRRRVPSTTFAEYPASAIEVADRRIPVAGGGFWRLLPKPWILASVRAHERRGEPFVAYIHPHELDPAPLRATSRRQSVWMNVGRASIRDKLAAVLAAFRFGTCGPSPTP